MATSISTTSESDQQRFDVFGVQLEFLVAPDKSSDQTSLYRGTLGPGVLIPLHSHPEAELFYVLDGAIDVYMASGSQEGWSTHEAGRVVKIEGGVLHAVRNTDSGTAEVILVTGKQLYGFFRKIAQPMNGGPAIPTPEDMQRLFAAAAQYDYWMGSPEENAAIGIALP